MPLDSFIIEMQLELKNFNGADFIAGTCAFHMNAWQVPSTSFATRTLP